MKKIFFCFSMLFVQAIYSQLTLTSFTPTSPQFGFGEAVDTFGDEIIVTESSLLFQSKVFIFKKTTNEITQTNELSPADGSITDAFGFNISLNNDFIAVGSPFNDQNGFDAGAVYIYRKVNDTWSFFQKLTAFDGTGSDYFGYNVKVNNNKLFISAPSDDLDTESSDANSGSIYVYDFNGNAWNFSQKLSLSNTKGFGQKMDVENNRLVTRSSATATPQFQDNMVHTFIYNGTDWNYTNTLFPNGAAAPIFDLCLDDNKLYFLLYNNVASYETSGNGWSYLSTTGPIHVNDNVATKIAVYQDIMLIGQTEYILQMTRKSPVVYYKKISGVWTNQQTIYSDELNTNQDDSFGKAIAISQDLIVIGCPRQGSPPSPGKTYVAYTADLGLNGFSNEESIIYPNPTNGELFLIENMLTDLNVIQIYQMDGKLVSEIMPSHNSVNLNSFEKGMYILKFIYNNHISLTKKIIKN